MVQLPDTEKVPVEGAVKLPLVKVRSVVTIFPVLPVKFPPV